MPGFVWNAFRLARLRSAVRSYNAAITRRAKELEDMGVASYAQYLPEKKTVEDIKSRIYTVNDFRRIVGYKNDVAHGRYSELTRVLKKANPHALDIVEDKQGHLTTNYEIKQFQYDKADIRRNTKLKRELLSTELFEGDQTVDFDSLSEPELGTLSSNTDILPEDAGEPDDSVEDVDQETLAKWRREDAGRKRQQMMPDPMFEVYMDTWKNPLNMHQAMPGYHDLIDAMEWLLHNRVDVLNKMFAEGWDELDPMYITESGGASNPYVNTPYETRHNRAVRFIVNRARTVGYEG